MANNNKHTGPNVPALRFPEFSGEWEKMSLQDCCSDFSYGLNAPAKAYDGVNKYIRITDIDENTSVYKSDDPVSPDGLLSDEYLVNENDILFARTGASTGKTYLYNQNDGRLFYAGFLIKANVNNNCDPYFIFSQTKTQSYRRWVEIMSTRSGQPGINSQEYASYPLYVPSKEEQEKIALLLRGLDKRILVQSKIIKEQETLLKSLADKLISAQSANVAICGCVDAKASTMKEGELESHGAFPVFGASGLCGYSNEALEESDSILVTKDGSGVGTCQYATGAHSFLGTLCSLTAKEGVYLPYVYYALLNFNFASFKTGLAIPHIYFKDYGKAVIYCPSYDEQVRIASGLEKLEAKINTDKELLKQYQLQKEYLLSRMFI